MKPIIDKIKELNFPSGEYVVVGSGILSALGIRESNDIDIAVLPKLHRELVANEEWKKDERYRKASVSPMLFYFIFLIFFFF